MSDSRKLEDTWVVWLRCSIWFELYCQSSQSSYPAHPLGTSCRDTMTEVFPLLNVCRVCVCMCVCVCVFVCIYTLICASILITKSGAQRQTHNIFSHPFFRLASRSSPPPPPTINPHSLSPLADPRPFGPVVWAVFWRRSGALSFPEPRPVLPADRPGGSGCGGPGIRVRAEWLGPVVSPPAAHTHAGRRRCGSLISCTYQLMLGHVLAVTGN